MPNAGREPACISRITFGFGPPGLRMTRDCWERGGAAKSADVGAAYPLECDHYRMVMRQPDRDHRRTSISMSHARRKKQVVQLGAFTDCTGALGRLGEDEVVSFRETDLLQ